MNASQIHFKIQETITELLNHLAGVDQEQINMVPFEGSWTPGQLVQHVIISGSGLLEMINGPVKETARKPDEMEERIKADFLDFSTKMKSPEFVKPPVSMYKKEELVAGLKSVNEKTDKATQRLDLTKTCLAFELPVYGYLTRLEALYFILYHTQRHIHQFKNLVQKQLSEEYKDNISR